ncbi:hypothetical protein V6M85_08515 [Sulfolobus tengchongensis]|uniref:Uncharacterized protein n=1 Tax=Sulfolobus tengchongensis TaxID=207809 RepID=A0AAX4KZC4_9CREN
MNLLDVKKIYSEALFLSRECKKCVDCEACDKAEELLDILVENIDNVSFNDIKEREEFREILNNIFLIRKELLK